MTDLRAELERLREQWSRLRHQSGYVGLQEADEWSAAALDLAARLAQENAGLRKVGKYARLFLLYGDEGTAAKLEAALASSASPAAEGR